MNNLSEPDEKPLDAAKIQNIYKKARANLVEVIATAKIVSTGASGIYAEHPRLFWASVLFTRLVVTACSILRLAPRVEPREANANWDFSALGSVVRNIAECYFVFFYLCAEVVTDDDEWTTRLNLIQLRDNKTRWKMISDFGIDSDQEIGFAGHHTDLTARLKGRLYFQSLPEKRQAELLKGDKDPFTQDEILDRMGRDRGTFRGYYRYLCSHTHTGPISFYRMVEHDRGRGIENSYDKGAMGAAMDVASDFLKRATDDMIRLFPNAQGRGQQTSGNRQARRRNKTRG